VPNNGVAGTGGGGGGANGTIGGNGGSGIVIIRYALPKASNRTATTVGLTFNGDHATAGELNAAGPSSNGVLVRQYTTLVGSTCGTTWTAESFESPTFPLSMTLDRARCYRWTYDPGLSSSAAPPVDETGRALDANLTSPVLLLPDAPTATGPVIVPVDPTSSTVDIPIRLWTGTLDKVMVCAYPTSASSLDGAGSPAANGFTIDVGTFGSYDVSGEGLVVESDRTSAVLVSGDVSLVADDLARIRITLDSGAFKNRKYLLLRAVPILNGFVSSCNPLADDDLVVDDVSVALVTIKPLARTGTDTVNIGLN
jgi:hypothetical protein